MVPLSEDCWRLMSWKIRSVKLAHCLSTCKDSIPAAAASEQHTKGGSAWLAVRTHVHPAAWAAAFYVLLNPGNILETVATLTMPCSTLFNMVKIILELIHK